VEDRREKVSLREKKKTLNHIKKSGLTSPIFPRTRGRSRETEKTRVGRKSTALYRKGLACGRLYWKNGLYPNEAERLCIRFIPVKRYS